MTRMHELILEVENVLEQRQPQLAASLHSDRIEVQGKFVCASDQGPFDQFNIKLLISDLFPDHEPYLWEVDERIPRTTARHVFTKSGRCCLGLWEAWLARTPNAGFDEYLRGPVTSYFISQSIYDLTGEWPFGEQGHSREEIAATYSEAISLPVEFDRTHSIELLGAPLLSGNPRCPCGSGAKLRDCHWDYFRNLRRSIPAFVRRDMRERLDAMKSSSVAAAPKTAEPSCHPSAPPSSAPDRAGTVAPRRPVRHPASRPNPRA